MAMQRIQVYQCWCENPACKRGKKGWISRIPIAATSHPPKMCPYCGDRRWNVPRSDAESPN